MRRGASWMCQTCQLRSTEFRARHERGGSAPAGVQSDGAASRHRYGHARPRKRSARATEGRESAVLSQSRSKLGRIVASPRSNATRTDA